MCRQTTPPDRFVTQTPAPLDTLMHPNFPLLINALRSHRDSISAAAGLLRSALSRVIDPDPVVFSEAVHWMALTLEFKPDIVLEIGRGRIHSTVAFGIAAKQLGACRVQSFGAAGDPLELVLAAAEGAGWPSCVELINGVSSRHDFRRHIGSAKRPLVFWNSCGFDWADTVIAHILPSITNRPHLVICTDIWDSRFSEMPSGYAGRPLWRGMEDYLLFRIREERAPLRLGWFATTVDHAIPLMDFCARNRIELHSPSMEFAQLKPEILAALREDLPEDMRCSPTGWSWFCLRTANPPYSFPSLPILGGQIVLASENAPARVSPEATAQLPQKLHAALESESCAEALAQLREELDAVYASSSWRLTRPYRTIGRLAKRVGGLKNRSAPRQR
jgi:hypothetical protein